MSFAAEEAKAQTACDGKATFDVFTPSSGTHTTPAGGSVDLDGTLAEIFNSNTAAWSGTHLILRSESGVFISNLGIAPTGNNVPTFGGATPAPGQLIDIAHQTLGMDITLRVYTRSDSMLGLTQRTATETDTCDTGLTGMTGMPFFLTNGYAETTAAAMTNIGYAAPMCIGDQTNPDGLMCVDPTCVGDQTLTDGVCVDPTCIGDQTIVAGVCTDPTCVAPQVVVMGVCSDPSEMPEMPEREMPENETPATPAASEATTDNDAHQTAAFIGGGMVVVGGLVWYLSGGNFALFATTPEFGYSITESGYSANIGGRADFRQDRWHLYWTAGQQSVNGDFGDFRYSSGGKWQGDIFAAAFSEKVQGETADYDVSLSADWTGGIWKVSPEFAAHSVYEKGEFATTNSFRINGEMRVDDWRFSASGNQTQMELSAVYRF